MLPCPRAGAWCCCCGSLGVGGIRQEAAEVRLSEWATTAGLACSECASAMQGEEARTWVVPFGLHLHLKVMWCVPLALDCVGKWQFSCCHIYQFDTKKKYYLVQIGLSLCHGLSWLDAGCPPKPLCHCPS